MCEQRLHLLSQGCIAGAGFGQKRVALAIRDVESGIANRGDPLPSFRIHSDGALQEGKRDVAEEATILRTNP